MSRFRLSPSLVVSLMVAGIMEKTVDDTPATPQPLQRRVQVRTQTKPGCRQTFCREKERCHCSCKKCKQQCLFRDVMFVEQENGSFRLQHSDGMTIPMRLSDGTEVIEATKDQYEAMPANFRSYFKVRMRPSVKPG